MGYLKMAVAIFVLALSGGGLAYLVMGGKEQAPPTPPAVVEVHNEISRAIGTSIEGRAIEAYTFGSGASHLLFVGGIHGGYEWNSVLLAYEAIDYFTENPTVIPSSVRVSIIPNANPDGVYVVVKKEGRFRAIDVPTDTGALGRFNARSVDLNRNFECKWQPESIWRGKKVNAGTAAFSEPESRVIRDYVLKEKPSAVVFWHSQANAVYASECTAGVLPTTRTLMQVYAKAAKYPAIDTFDAYEVTGDAEGWLASINIPAITVELASHEEVEWERNRAGIEAVLREYGRKDTP